MAKGFLYLIAIIDWYSRKVLAWELSNSLDTRFCLEALETALKAHGPPDLFNTDQGSQFTSDAFTTRLKDSAIRISMDGKGRWVDNVFVERLWRSLKDEEVVCYERAFRWNRWERCFIRDEGRPLGVGLQEQASNHPKLRRSRAAVVSVGGKGGARLRQVRIRETNASEPLMTCRNVSSDVETGTRISVPRSGWGRPAYRSTGVRHEGGVTRIQALVRNVGTCRPDAKGEPQAAATARGRVPMRDTGAESPILGRKAL
jgi:transposase InsO family protein